MKILINVLRYRESAPAGGNKTYVYNLTPKLVEKYPEHDWIILAAEDNENYFKMNAPGADIRSFRLHPRMLFRIPKEHLIVRRALKEFNPDVYYNPATLLPFGKMKCASVVTIHDINFTHFSQGYWHDRYKWRLYSHTCESADRIMADSRFTADDLAAKFPVCKGKVEVVYAGVSEDFFQQNFTHEELKGIRQKYHLPDRYILSIGHFPHKNVSGLMRVFAGLNPDISGECSLVVTGIPDSDKIRYQREAAALEISEKVILLEYLTKKDFRGLLKSARVFAFPSLFEGFGLPVLEAMASGCPVIASDRTSIPEVAGDAGIVCDPDDIVKFRNELSKLLTDENLRRDLIAKGMARAKEFNWGRTA
nr:glycosyltransferase family 4 protein [FCB group bacterium]